MLRLFVGIWLLAAAPSVSGTVLEVLPGRAWDAVTVACLLLFIGAMGKSAQMPLHVWLPNAYTFTPHAGTVFLAACATKVSLYVLLSFDFVVFQQNLMGHEAQFAAFLMPLAVMGILVASAVALFESNIKKALD